MDATGQYRPVWTSARAYLGEPASRAPARTVRRIATLERDSPRLVKTADRAGVGHHLPRHRRGICRAQGVSRAAHGLDNRPGRQQRHE